MLRIRVGAVEAFDDEKNEFVETGGIVLDFEHSLVSLSKWESDHEKPFLDNKGRTGEETLAYVEAMLLTESAPADWVLSLSEDNLKALNDYIGKKMTATWFAKTPQTKGRETITAELIYYWMTVFNIPWEAQHWHLNRLFTLIRICNEKQAKPKKRSRAEVASERAKLNEQRRREMGSKG